MLNASTYATDTDTPFVKRSLDCVLIRLPRTRNPADLIPTPRSTPAGGAFDGLKGSLFGYFNNISDGS